MIFVRTRNSIYKIDKEKRKVLSPTKGWINYRFILNLEVGKSLFIAWNECGYIITSTIVSIHDDGSEPEFTWSCDL